MSNGMNIQRMEGKLETARKRLKEAISALRSKPKGGEQEAYQRARNDVLALEREVAAAKGEEYAITIDFPVLWDTGAPLPHVLSNDSQVFLIFYLATFDPDWDGTHAKMRKPDDETAESLAVVEFQRPLSVKFGSPNDEVFSGHPLYGKGLEFYRAQVVENSRWIAEIESINKVHPNYNPETWHKLHHYILWFHDTTFECIARRYEVETYHESLGSVMERVSKRLLK